MLTKSPVRVSDSLHLATRQRLSNRSTLHSTTTTKSKTSLPSYVAARRSTSERRGGGGGGRTTTRSSETAACKSRAAASAFASASERARREVCRRAAPRSAVGDAPRVTRAAQPEREGPARLVRRPSVRVGPEEKCERAGAA